MFSRTPERQAAEDGRRGGLQPVDAPTPASSTPAAGTGSAATAPAATTTRSAGPIDQTLIASEDRFEGTIRARTAIRVLGTVKGTLEAPTVIIEEGASVTADVSADDVMVAGEYSGNMTCRARLEVRPSGRMSGRLEVLKLVLEEGAAVDGEIHMLKPGNDGSGNGVTPSARSYSPSSVRMAVGADAARTSSALSSTSSLSTETADAG